MRIFVVEPYGTGGMIHFAYQLCSAMADAGADVTLVTSTDYEMRHLTHNFAVEARLRLWPTNKDVAAMQIKPKSKLALQWRKGWVTARRGFRAALLIREWTRLTRYLLQQRPDIVQVSASCFPYDGVFLRWLRYQGITLTQICHEFQDRDWNWRWFALLKTRVSEGIFQNFMSLFFLGEKPRQVFLDLFDIPPERTHIIPHGNQTIFAVNRNPSVDLRSRYGLDSEDRVVLFFGAISPYKGVPDLLTAFALLRQSGPRAKLLIAGYPTRFVNVQDLRLMANELTIDDAVIFDPRYIPMDEVGSLIELSTVVVFPYRSATQSGALQAAYTFGRAVIVTEVGGLPEVVEQGRSGLVVPPNSPERLAQALQHILANPRLAKEMGNYSLNLSRTKYAWGRIAGKVLSVYQTLYGNRGEDQAAPNESSIEAQDIHNR